MSGYSMDYNAGNIVFKPRRPRPGKYPILLMHGMGGNARTFNALASFRQSLFARRLALGNFSLMTASMGDGFGASSESTDIETMRTAAATLLPQCDNSKMVLIGISMGHANAWAERRDNPTRVAGIVGIMPAVDLEDIRTRDPIVGSRAAIDAAWGVTYPTALPSGALFQTNAATLRGIPYKAYYSTGDTVVPQASVLSFVTAMQGTSEASGSAAHGDIIMTDVSVSSVSAFLLSCGA